MKYVDEYRDKKMVQYWIQKIVQSATRDWKIMEVCGGQTHSIIKYGLDQLLPNHIELIHGPGCPVCVTPLEMIDKAIEIASIKKVIFCSFGDMLRVPGSNKDLLSVKAKGADVRIVYSPLDCLKIAQENPSREIVFFAVGFETTAPANAMAILQAKMKQINNFSVLISHVLVPPAMEAMLSSSDNQVNAYLAAGHVCTVMGFHQYHFIAEKYQVPIVVTGFEPVDIVQGVAMCVSQLEEGRYVVENQYIRSVNERGNAPAQKILDQVFQIKNQKWRGLGSISNSGFTLQKDFKEFDAEFRFQVKHIEVEEPLACMSGVILQGLKKPNDCPEFGKKCTPEHPLGATMVSNEGACSAYYRYRNWKKNDAYQL